MILEQFYLACLSQASYVVADERTRRACVVDPRRDTDVYVQFAKDRGLRITHVALTHFHADFLAGHLELAKKTGARIVLGRRAKADYEFEPLGEGQSIELGDVRLEVLETPGHTPEGVCYLVRKGTDAPHAVLTGDTLFLGDVGRPDLMASIGVTEDELARALFHSLSEKLWPLPDDTIVYPGHGAGSMCGKALSDERFAKLGDQRVSNLAFATAGSGDEEAFVSLVCAGQPDPPAYFAFDADLNRRKRATLEESLARFEALPLARFLTRADGGAQVVDTRAAAKFEPRHLAGSINVGLDGSFATWAGTVLDHTRPIVVITEPGREREAALRLGRIGFDRVEGYLEDGAAALERAPERLGAIARIEPAALAERVARADRPLVVDVRTPGEFAAAHIEGAVNVPLRRLSERQGELPRDRPLVLHCKSGYRSAVAASLLERARFTDLTDLVGGFDRWSSEVGGGRSPACSA